MEALFTSLGANISQGAGSRVRVERTYSGKLNVRLKPDMHQRAAY
ncbi:MAG: toxin-antitoxin system HicB family antitoxin, partial [Lachnospiraceae bacterium]|nr:toxin-antitoxin system HicB family antitoxin [Lachnospiraceae bacterium]